MAETVLTTSAFEQYRKHWSPDQDVHPDAVRFDGDEDKLTQEDGLLEWSDGPAQMLSKAPGPPPDVGMNPDNMHLWAVTTDAVLHAREKCQFGSVRGAGRLKHSNLTGGGKAYAGGELVFLDADSIVLTGCSGRYRLRGAEELKSISSAFRASGYNVWSMGYNADTNRPALFGTQDPEWVMK